MKYILGIILILWFIFLPTASISAKQGPIMGFLGMILGVGILIAVVTMLNDDHNNKNNGAAT